MNSTRETRTGESGSTLVVVMISAIIILISATAIMETGAQDAVLAVRGIRTSRTFYNAEAGTERGEAWLLGGQTPLPTNPTMPLSADPEMLGWGLYHVAIAPDATGGRRGAAASG